MATLRGPSVTRRIIAAISLYGLLFQLAAAALCVVGLPGGQTFPICHTAAAVDSTAQHDHGPAQPAPDDAQSCPLCAVHAGVLSVAAPKLEVRRVAFVDRLDPPVVVAQVGTAHHVGSGPSPRGPPAVA